MKAEIGGGGGKKKKKINYYYILFNIKNINFGVLIIFI
jgi:hypothetical protein